MTDVDIGPESDFYNTERFVALFRIYGDRHIALSAAALVGATSLSVRPLAYPLTSGQKFFFPGSGFMVKLSASAVPGATTLSVATLSGPLPIGATGRLVLAPNSYTLRWLVEPLPPQTLATVASIIPTFISDPADPDGSPISISQVVKATSVLSAAVPGVYRHRFVRIDAGFDRTLAEGELTIKGH